MFDRLLVEVLEHVSTADIPFVVRGQPILNDATFEDARCVRLGRLVPFIDKGNDAPATVLFEAPGNIYFLFQVKCPGIGQAAGAEVGKYMLARLRQGNGLP